MAFPIVLMGQTNGTVKVKNIFRYMIGFQKIVIPRALKGIFNWGARPVLYIYKKKKVLVVQALISYRTLKM